MRNRLSLRLVTCLPESRSMWATIAFAAAACLPAWGQQFTPGNLVVSRSVYAGTASTVTVGQTLPPNCVPANGCAVATANGTYPGVWQNDTADGSFGVTSPVFLDQITPSGALVNVLAVNPNVLTTSFSSKSEVALNLSTDGRVITFMGYVAPQNTVDVSNSNTPGVFDSTNPVAGSFYRAVAQVDANGNVQITETNAYSGNNGRAAIRANNNGTSYYYMVGNANNGSGTPANVVASAGVQIAAPSGAVLTSPQPDQFPGNPVEVGSFSVTQTNPLTGLPYGKADKLGKDNNFRGLTIFNNNVYISKGSGSNGINTVYRVDNAGILANIANAPSAPITVLPGFNAVIAKTATAGPNPFGLWFANANTLYVADEGDGTAADAATSNFAGLQKWSLVNGIWQLDYVLQRGLNLGVPYGIVNYPSSLNPATDGLRNITGRVNANGTVTVWAVTSTISSNGDQGADPNLLVTVTDVLANTNPASAAGENFTVVRAANYGEVLRGVSFTPGTIVESAGPIFVTDGGRVEQFSATGGYVNQFAINGGGRFPDGVAGMAMDVNGNFFLTDIANKNVSEFGSNGAFVKSFGSYGSGNGQFLNGIGGVAANATGDVWVVDAGNYRVQEFSTSGAYLGQFGTVGKGNGQFQSPSAIVIDPLGNIWVTDGGRVQEFSSTGAYVSQFAITGGGRFPNGVGGMAIDANGNFWITDIGSKNVSEFSSSGAFVKSFGSYGSSNGQFLNGMSGIAIDANGSTWVSDAGNFRVQEFSTNGVFEETIGTQGKGNGQFQSPGAIVIR